LQVTEVTANTFRNRFGTAAIHNDNFETWAFRLLRQRLQTPIKHRPVVVTGDNDAEQGRLTGSVTSMDHAAFGFSSNTVELYNATLTNRINTYISSFSRQIK
jgi:hypothetical protein